MKRASSTGQIAVAVVPGWGVAEACSCSSRHHHASLHLVQAGCAAVCLYLLLREFVE